MTDYALPRLEVDLMQLARFSETCTDVKKLIVVKESLGAERRDLGIHDRDIELFQVLYMKINKRIVELMQGDMKHG